MPKAEIHAFVRAVEAGSLLGAASMVRMTPSAVRDVIARLERRLGVTLFRESGKVLRLTEAGESYYPRARRIVDDQREAEAGLSGEPKGRVVIGSARTFGLAQLVPALASFRARYPEIELGLALSDDVAAPALRHADVTLRTGGEEQTRRSAQTLAFYGQSLCAAPAYLERWGTPQVPADLAGHACLAGGTPATWRWTFETPDGDLEERPFRPSVTADGDDARLQLALEGLGIARLPDFLVAGPIGEGRLVPLLTAAHSAPVERLDALYLQSRRRIGKVAACLDFLQARFSEASWNREAEASEAGAAGHQP